MDCIRLRRKNKGSNQGDGSCGLISDQGDGSAGSIYKNLLTNLAIGIILHYMTNVVIVW